MQRIGIVVPALDEIRNLRQLLQSLNDQSHPELISLIAIAAGDNNLSGYLELCNSFPNLGSKIKVIRNEKKITPAGLNIGIKECISSGIDIIQFLGAHSAVRNDFIFNLSKSAEQFPEIDIFNSSLLFTTAETAKEKSIQLFTYSRLGRNWKDFFDDSQKGFITGIFAVRRKVIESTGLFNEKFIKNQDIEFVKRAFEKGCKARLFKDLIYYYKVRPGILSTMRQMFSTGKFVAMNFSRVNFKQLAPVLFYSLITFLLILYIFSSSWTVLIILLFILLIYLAALFFETIRFLFKGEKSAIILPVIFFLSHLVYAAGTFNGICRRFRA